jgi:pyrophosphatase PpaX
MHLKALLFDLDGTLADTLPMCIQAYQQSLEWLLERPVSEEEITAHFGLTEAGIFQLLADKRWEEGLQEYHRLYKQLHIDYSEPFAGIKMALDLLKERGVKMAVVTGKGAQSADYTLKYLGLMDYFTIVSAGSEDAIIKSRSIGEILRSWQIAPGEAAYIGDADTDIREAELAGVLPLAAEWSAHATIARLAKKPEITFSSVHEFLQWIEENTR